MKSMRRPKLFAEQLEERDCPSFVFRLFDSTLYVTGSPTGAGGSGVLFTQTANNQWSVSDHGTTILSKVNVSNIALMVTEHNADPITFNLGGFTDSGNLTVNLGSGDNSLPVQSFNGLSVYNGTLGGNLLILNGSGQERVHLGYIQNSAASATAGALTVGGNVAWSAKENPNLLVAGNPQGNILDTGTEPAQPPFVPAAVNIGGNLTTTGVGAVQLAAATTVGGNVAQTMLRSQILVADAGDLFFGTINGNLTIQGATGSPKDVIQIGDTTDTAVIGGNLSINLGNGANELEDSAPFTVNGNTFIQMGNGNNAIGLGGTYYGSLSVNLGNGNNTDGSTAPHFFNADPFFSATSSVGGNFSLNVGNGNNDLTPAANGGFAGSVGGLTNLAFGNGTDSFTIASSTLGGPINWHSGNGNDTLNLAPTAVATYNVDALFGNGNDSFALNGPVGTTLYGTVNGGGRITANTFFQATGDVLGSNFNLINFP